MTSEERRNARFQRRKAKREAKRNEKLSKYTYENVISAKHLYEAAYEAAKGIRWKASVQRYLMNICKNIGKTRKMLIAGKDVRKGFICFDLIERGKLRHIRSVHFSERVVQKSLCKNALYPIFTDSLIFDNGASQKGKGTKFATDRFVKHLVRHIRHHGRKGGILFIDFSDYFGNVDHDVLWEIYEMMIDDPRLRDFAFLFVDAFEKGLGLGSETSQINAIILANRADHYAKEVLRIKGYVRYMDDTAIIHEDVEYLKECLERLKVVYARLGINVNDRKTKICDLKHGFTYLKTRFFITKSGHIIKKPCRESIVRERRKLKKQKALLDKGILSFGDIRTSYASWRGSMAYRDAYRTVKNMDALFNRLFIENKKSIGTAEIMDYRRKCRDDYISMIIENDSWYDYYIQMKMEESYYEE